MPPGGNQLAMRIKGSTGRIRAVLDAVKGISAIEVEDSPEPEYTDAIVGMDDGLDLRETIFFALANASCPAVMIKPTKPTLEEIFMRLTA